MKDKLQEIGLNSDNSVIIGSGILQALKIRKSMDIDLVVTQEAYDSLEKSGKFAVLTDHSRKILKDDAFDIGTDWNVLGKIYRLEDFANDSIIIGGVRYATLDFIYRVKSSWVKEGCARPKDFKDVKLIETYMKTHCFPTRH